MNPWHLGPDPIVLQQDRERFVDLSCVFGTIAQRLAKSEETFTLPQVVVVEIADRHRAECDWKSGDFRQALGRS